MVHSEPTCYFAAFEQDGRSFNLLAESKHPLDFMVECIENGAKRLVMSGYFHIEHSHFLALKEAYTDSNIKECLPVVIVEGD